jgi:hypothetical protein
METIFSLPLPGQCRNYPDNMQIQSRGSFRVNFGTGTKHMGSLLDRNNQHKPDLSGQEHDPYLSNQIRRYRHSGTMDHVISADESKTIEIQKKTMDWTGELVLLFGQANTKGIHTAIQGLRMKYNGEFDARELFKGLDQIKPAEAHWTFTSPAAMIVIALAIFLICMIIWKMCINKTNPTKRPILTPSAPPMPTLNQPQRPLAKPMTNNQATKLNTSIPIHINIS